MMSWVAERVEEERFCARVQPAQPVPRIRMRGLESVDGDGERLDCLQGVEVAERARFELDFGAEVGAGEEGREEI
jgi:hypothetical protein